jgi:hypothetical protein
MADDTKQDLKWAVALLVVFLLGSSAALAKYEAPPNDWWTPFDQYPHAGAENLTTITGQFMTGDPASSYAGAQNSAGIVREGLPLVAPFEILSVLLIATLVGAIAVASRDEPRIRHWLHAQAGRMEALRPRRPRGGA